MAIHTLEKVGTTGITVDRTASEATHLRSPQMPTGNEISIGFFPLVESISFTHLVYISLPVRALAHNFHLILSGLRSFTRPDSMIAWESVSQSTSGEGGMVARLNFYTRLRQCHSLK